MQIYDEGDDLASGQVDAQLVRLARSLGAWIVTNDYNLNKIAELQGVRVLNVNELANAIKPVMIPGEELTVHVIKDGKEAGQGVGYLDDGTMIVVEGGKKHIGETLDTVVTSVLQTVAGRMIFARPKVFEKDGAPRGPQASERRPSSRRPAEGSDWVEVSPSRSCTWRGGRSCSMPSTPSRRSSRSKRWRSRCRPTRSAASSRWRATRA